MVLGDVKSLKAWDIRTSRQAIYSQRVIIFSFSNQRLLRAAEEVTYVTRRTFLITLVLALFLLNTVVSAAIAGAAQTPHLTAITLYANQVDQTIRFNGPLFLGTHTVNERRADGDRTQAAVATIEVKDISLQPLHMTTHGRRRRFYCSSHRLWPH